jgi:hypothetical protein
MNLWILSESIFSRVLIFKSVQDSQVTQHGQLLGVSGGFDALADSLTMVRARVLRETGLRRKIGSTSRIIEASYGLPVLGRLLVGNTIPWYII